MTPRAWALVVVLGAALVTLALLAGVATDRLILGRVANGPPQRLAAAMGGLFAGGLVFFGGLIAGLVWRRADSRP